MWTNTSYIGSLNVIFMSSVDSIEHKSPACIAAQLVNMVAKNILMGVEGQGDLPIPVRLYSPEKIFIKASQVSVGVFKVLADPERAVIYCDKLILSKTPDQEEPESFEIVQSWVVNDSTEIEKVTR